MTPEHTVTKPDGTHNIEWLEDADGPYWRGELRRNGRRIGYTGNYYDRGSSVRDPALVEKNSPTTRTENTHA